MPLRVRQRLAMPAAGLRLTGYSVRPGHVAVVRVFADQMLGVVEALVAAVPDHHQHMMADTVRPNSTVTRLMGRFSQSISA